MLPAKQAVADWSGGGQHTMRGGIVTTPSVLASSVACAAMLLAWPRLTYVQSQGAMELAGLYSVHVDVTYQKAGGWVGKLDVYQPNGTGPSPTVVYFHGGGWTVPATKESVVLQLVPFLEAGFAVVNVEWRGTDVAEAPAMVEDGRCALRWVMAHANEYKFDADRIITAGESNGGYLALMAGMLPVSAGFDRHCPGTPTPKVAAIVDWYGHVDLAARLGGPETLSGINMYIGSRSDRVEMARRVSPVTYVRPGLPPLFITHGDADEVIPFEQSIALTDALRRSGVDFEFLPVSGGKHGYVHALPASAVWPKVFAFLRQRGLAPSARTRR